MNSVTRQKNNRNPNGKKQTSAVNKYFKYKLEYFASGQAGYSYFLAFLGRTSFLYFFKFQLLTFPYQNVLGSLTVSLKSLKPELEDVLDFYQPSSIKLENTGFLINLCVVVSIFLRFKRLFIRTQSLPSPARFAWGTVGLLILDKENCEQSLIFLAF